MSIWQVKPLEDIESSPRERPVSECLGFKQEGDEHIALEDVVIDLWEAPHHEVALPQLCHSIFNLQSWGEEVKAVDQVEYYQGPIHLKLVAFNNAKLFLLFIAVPVALQLDIAFNGEVEEHEGMDEQEEEPLKVKLAYYGKGNFCEFEVELRLHLVV